MSEITIKYFAIIYSSRYFYSKIQNIVPTKSQQISNLLFSILLASSISIIRKNIPSITFPVIILLSIVFSLLSFKQSAYATVISNIISIGMSNILSVFALAICSFFSVLICNYTPIEKKNIFLYFSSFAILHLLLMTIPFRFRRLKKGIPLLSNAKFSSIGITISIISILISSLFTPQTEPRIDLIIIFLIVPLCGIFIIIWWKNRITEKYVKETKKRSFISLKNELIEKEAKLSILTEENNELSAIIHKDNKLIPSMELAVTELLNSVTNDFEKDTLLINTSQILNHLKSISKERSGIIKNYEKRNQSLSKTNIITIDSLMMYMLKKSSEHSINFKVVAADSLSFLNEDLEFEADLLTMLADLIENAIIATKSSVQKNIAVHITNKDIFSIEVFDSAPAFDYNVIQNFGIKKTTSHKKEGGSGIGLMSLYLLAKKYAASLILEEFSKNKLYKKKVSLLFNKETQIIIHTNREDILSLKSKRPDILFETPLESSLI